MAQLLVRNLDAAVKQALKRRALRHGRSMEEEARMILTMAAENRDTQETESPEGLGTKMATLFRDLDLNEPVPTWHGQEALPASFES